MKNIKVKKLTKEEFEDFILMKKIEDTSLEEITELLLNQSYLVMFWQQAYEQRKEQIEKLKEQLNDEIDDELKQSEIMVKKQEEIERLNNIINELEKWLESEIQRLEKFQNPKRGVKPYGQEYNNITFLIGAYDNALDKLQELKGSDKE